VLVGLRPRELPRGCSGVTRALTPMLLALRRSEAPTSDGTSCSLRDRTACDLNVSTAGASRALGSSHNTSNGTEFSYRAIWSLVSKSAETTGRNGRLRAACS
jgi:hypothetical protein